MDFMRWAILTLKIPNNWMTQLLHDHSDVHIGVFNCMPHESGGGRGLIRLRSDENMSAILDGIRSRKDVIKSR
jgi:hypothetical protein